MAEHGRNANPGAGSPAVADQARFATRARGALARRRWSAAPALHVLAAVHHRDHRSGRCREPVAGRPADHLGGAPGRRAPGAGERRVRADPAPDRGRPVLPEVGQVRARGFHRLVGLGLVARRRLRRTADRGQSADRPAGSGDLVCAGGLASLAVWFAGRGAGAQIRLDDALGSARLLSAPARQPFSGRGLRDLRSGGFRRAGTGPLPRLGPGLAHRRPRPGCVAGHLGAVRRRRPRRRLGPPDPSGAHTGRLARRTSVGRAGFRWDCHRPGH